MELKVRFEPLDLRRVEDMAHAARLPVSVYIRVCALGESPKAAPPVPAALGVGARHLLAICHSLISNLSQIESHAARLGEPLARLAGADGALQKMSNQARKLGMKIKAGEQNDEQEIRRILELLEAESQSLNRHLAMPLNDGQAVDLAIWKQILSALKTALQDQDADG